MLRERPKEIAKSQKAKKKIIIPLADFLTETLQARREWNDTFKILKEKKKIVQNGYSVPTLPCHKAATTRLGISFLMTPRNKLVLSYAICSHTCGMGTRGLQQKFCQGLLLQYLTSDKAMEGFSFSLIMQFTKSRTHRHISSPRV